MKGQTPRFFQAYREGLCRYLQKAGDDDLDEANRLGERAVGLGLEILEVARLHEEALIGLILDPSAGGKREELIASAGIFFAKAVTPSEVDHRSVQEDRNELKATVEELRQRTQELDASNLALKEEVKRRELVEKSLRISESTTSQLLAKALDLQEELRFLNRRLLVAKEEERKRISRELRDVIIAQALTATSVHLAALAAQMNGESELGEKTTIRVDISRAGGGDPREPEEKSVVIPLN